MRLTPAQIGVRMICGHRLPFVEPIELSLEDRIRRGRETLVQIAGVDFEYDLQRWHDHLKLSRQGGYTWNRAIALPKVMDHAMTSEPWQQAVEALRRRGN